MSAAGQVGGGLRGPEGRAGCVCAETTRPSGRWLQDGVERDTELCLRPGNCSSPLSRGWLLKVKGLLGEGSVAEKGGCLLDTWSALWPMSSPAGLCRPVQTLHLFIPLQTCLLRPYYGEGPKGTQRGIRYTAPRRRAYGHTRHVPKQTSVR